MRIMLTVDKIRTSRHAAAVSFKNVVIFDTLVSMAAH